MSKQPNEIDLEACRWVVLLERGPLSAAQQEQFSRWLATDIRHQGALCRAEAACRSFDQLGALAGAEAFRLAPVPVTRRRALAAALAAASLAGVGVWSGTDWFADAPVKYATAIGEERTVVLADGSEVALNTATDLRVRYSTTRRDIHLTRGEAVFTVVQDLARPFTVAIGEWLVRAVYSTAFAVRGGDVDLVRVTITDGSVEMLSATSDDAQVPQRLLARQEVNVGNSRIIQVRPVSDQEIQRRLAWRAGMIVFEGQQLRDAITEMNRYRVRPLLVEDPILAEQQILGVFPTRDPQAFVSALQATLGLQFLSTRHGVLLRRATRSY